MNKNFWMDQEASTIPIRRQKTDRLSKHNSAIPPWPNTSVLDRQPTSVLHFTVFFLLPVSLSYSSTSIQACSADSGQSLLSDTRKSSQQWYGGCLRDRREGTEIPQATCLFGGSGKPRSIYRTKPADLRMRQRFKPEAECNVIGVEKVLCEDSEMTNRLLSTTHGRLDLVDQDGVVGRRRFGEDNSAVLCLYRERMPFWEGRLPFISVNCEQR
jgi:hypothetical protein